MVAKDRMPELDFLRGFTLIVMIFWHLGWDLAAYYGFPFDYYSGWIYWLGQGIAITFMTLAGISSIFTRNHQKRAAKVLLYAFIITVATYIFDPETVILFGILHFMGVNMLLYPYYKNWHPIVLVGLATGVFALGLYFIDLDMGTNLLLPLGLRSFSYSSLDYYPLAPYAAFFILGALVGPLLYPKGEPRLSFNIPSNPVNFVGKHTLIIYVLHQPVILAVLTVLAALGILHNQV